MLNEGATVRGDREPFEYTYSGDPYRTFEEFRKLFGTVEPFASLFSQGGVAETIYVRSFFLGRPLDFKLFLIFMFLGVFLFICNIFGIPLPESFLRFLRGT